MVRLDTAPADMPTHLSQQATCVFRHALATEPLLTLPALAAAATRLTTDAIERRVHDAPDGKGFTKLDPDPLMIERLARQGAVNEWVMLTRLETLHDYAELFQMILGGLPKSVRQRTGTPRNVKSFVFVSAPFTHTPFHFDAEWNVLFQIEGRKTFATLPPRAPFLSLAERETYQKTGENLLAWHSDFAPFAQEHNLGPGDSLFVPYEAPHWVRNGAHVSISLSLTWQDGWSRDVAQATRLGPTLRRLGLSPGDPAQGRRPRLSALAGRMASELTPRIWPRS